MSEVLVMGHRNPDTDSICAAIGYADFKRRTGMQTAVAARCGELNDRIHFVLSTFGAAPPKFVADVSPKIRDVMQSNVVSVPPRTTVAEALGIMDDRNIRVLPVLDADLKCKGLLSVFKMSKFFFPSTAKPLASRRVLATIGNLARTLNAKPAHMVEPDREDEMQLMIAAMAHENFAKRLASYKPAEIVLVVGDRADIQWLAIDKKVRVVVITGGLPIEEHLLEFARRNDVSVLLSPHDSASTAMLCRAAITVDHMSHDKFLSFRAEESIASVKGMAAASKFQAFPVVDDKARVVGILSKTDFLKKVHRKLILVDHNELSQAVHGADQVEILEVIDHHRIGSFTSAQPILFRNEPVGSTSTIVAEGFFHQQVELTPATAGLLLAGLISDTLNLTSPTTTERDASVLSKLEQVSGIQAGEFTEKLFASGSVLVSKTPDLAVVADCKAYAEKGRTFSVAQIEELGFDAFWKRRAELTHALDEHRAAKGYLFSALLVTDVVQQISLLLVAGPAVYVESIDYPEIEPGVFELEGVVSRKKQALPYLTSQLALVEPRLA